MAAVAVGLGPRLIEPALRQERALKLDNWVRPISIMPNPRR
jgi:hypothetical protein